MASETIALSDNDFPAQGTTTTAERLQNSYDSMQYFLKVGERNAGKIKSVQLRREGSAAGPDAYSNANTLFLGAAGLGLQRLSDKNLRESCQEGPAREMIERIRVLTSAAILRLIDTTIALLEQEPGEKAEESGKNYLKWARGFARQYCEYTGNSARFKAAERGMRL